MNLPPVTSAVASAISAQTVTPVADAVRNAAAGMARSDLARPAELGSDTQTAAAPSQNAQPSRSAVESAAKAVQEFVKPMSGNLEFTVDEDTGQTVIKVIDNQTKELIRQIPSEEMLEIAKALDRLQGLLVRQKA